MRAVTHALVVVPAIFAMVLGQAGVAAAARPKPPSGPSRPVIDAPGGVTVMSTTNGATVFVDGKDVGKIPMEDSIVLLPGQHTIKVTLRGCGDYLDTFEIAPGQEMELEIDLVPFAGIVRIDTKAPGATVKVDGKVEGVTPFDKDIAVGKRTIMVSALGFKDEVRTVDIRAGETHTLAFELKELPKPDSASAFYEKWWFWTIVGAAGAGAATAIALTAGGGTTSSPTPSFTLQIP